MIPCAFSRQQIERSSVKLTFTCLLSTYTYYSTEYNPTLTLTYITIFKMKVSEHDIEKRQLLKEKAATLECLEVMRAAQKEVANRIMLHNITDGESAAPDSQTSDGLPRMCTIERIVEFAAERLKNLLHIWKDCPGQTREMFAPGVPQLKEMSTKAVNHKGIRYPCLFFGFMCDAYICVLKQGESIEPSTLRTAWNGVQLSIQLNE
jgi:hypothetical protein